MIYPFEHIKIRHNPDYPLTEEIIRKRRRGDVLHLALSYIVTMGDFKHIEDYVKRALSQLLERPSKWNLKEDFVSPLERISGIKGAEKFFPDSLDGNIKVLAERSFLSGEKTLRPDRVVIRPDRAVIVDYKAHMPEESGILAGYKTQVSEYMDIVQKVFSVDVEGYLLFIDTLGVEEVPG